MFWGGPAVQVLWAGAILGFAFGGFFDGILLHQVLQWHHFLSLVPGERFQSIEVQILADGLFHLTVYLIALAGLIMLWRKGSYRPADRSLLGWAVLGFSIWQFADVVLVHWILGIHRIRVGVPNPLFWDVGWLIVFGVTSMFLGIWLLRTTGSPRGNSGNGVAAIISGCIVIGAVISSVPNGSSSTIVLFRSDMRAAQTFAAAADIDAGVVWGDPTGRILVLNLPPSRRAWSLYARGALMVGNTGLGGCLNWTRV
jgi:uncharacterized membrane protein